MPVATSRRSSQQRCRRRGRTRGGLAPDSDGDIMVVDVGGFVLLGRVENNIGMTDY